MTYRPVGTSPGRPCGEPGTGPAHLNAPLRISVRPCSPPRPFSPRSAFRCTRVIERTLLLHENGSPAAGNWRLLVAPSMRKTRNFNDPAHWFERADIALEDIGVPTLVIQAVDDTFVSVAHDNIPQSGSLNLAYETFEFGGHFVYIREHRPGRNRGVHRAVACVVRESRKAPLPIGVGTQPIHGGHTSCLRVWGPSLTARGML